jgi:hypothetical protein
MILMIEAVFNAKENTMAEVAVTCSIFISKAFVLIIKSTENGQGDITWLKPVLVIKGKPSPEELGASILEVFRNASIEKLSSGEILEKAGYKTWEVLTRESKMVSASLNAGKVTVSPYFSGAGGEYYLVLNRDRTVDANGYEVGNAVIKSLEYCG